MKFGSKFSISVLAIQLQHYHMSFINYISLGNTNMNIIRCKMHCLIQSPLPGCAKLSFVNNSYLFCNGNVSSSR